MANYTLFTSANIAGHRESVDDPQFAYQQNNTALKTVQNVKWYKIENWLLNLGDSRAISYPGYALADNTVLIAKVLGSAKMTIEAKDWDDSTDITGEVESFGNNIYPGYFYLSGYNIDTYSFESLQDGTVIEILFGVRE